MHGAKPTHSSLLTIVLTKCPGTVARSASPKDGWTRPHWPKVIAYHLGHVNNYGMSVENTVESLQSGHTGFISLEEIHIERFPSCRS